MAGRRWRRDVYKRQPQDSEEGHAGQAAGKQRANQARRLAIGVGLPAVEGCQAHLGPESDKKEHEAGVQPRPRQLRALAEQVVQLQADVIGQPQCRVADEHDAEHRQGNAHRTQQQVLPGRLDGQRIAVVVDERSTRCV